MKYAQFAAAGAAGLAVSFGAQAAGTLFSGSLQYNLSSGPIIATSTWASSATKLSWNISYDASNASTPWTYQYRWQGAGRDLSHIIIEVSNTQGALFADFTFPNVQMTVTGPGSNTAGGGANPNMPTTLFGIKFDVVPGPGAETDVSWSFRSSQAPTWGDFYAKDGKDGGVDVTAWNQGFTATDNNPSNPMPTDPVVNLVQVNNGDFTTLQHTGSRALHIAVPDTIQVPFIPEPGTVAAGLGVGVLTLGAFLRRRR